MTSGAPIIRLEDIVKNFSQGDAIVEVLKGITLTVFSGEFVALQGTSGSGKSTLMHILGLLDHPTAGRYFLQEQNVALLPEEELADLRNRTVGFIFQTFYLIPYISALQNVLLPGLYSRTSARELRRRAEETLAQVGLADRMHFMPGQLSGGQQQRVAMARALTNNPQVLLADEPTGQLDSKTSAEIMDLMALVHQQGRTVILVTHDPRTADYAQRRIIVHDGRIASD